MRNAPAPGRGADAGDETAPDSEAEADPGPNGDARLVVPGASDPPSVGAAVTPSSCAHSANKTLPSQPHPARANRKSP
jgi:hypothetical protein